MAREVQCGGEKHMRFQNHRCDFNAELVPNSTAGNESTGQFCCAQTDNLISGWLDFLMSNVISIDGV